MIPGRGYGTTGTEFKVLHWDVVAPTLLARTAETVWSGGPVMGHLQILDIPKIDLFTRPQALAAAGKALNTPGKDDVHCLCTMCGRGAGPGTLGQVE